MSTITPNHRDAGMEDFFTELNIVDRKDDAHADSFLAQVADPPKLANYICIYFRNHPDALISGFVGDIVIFEYLYEFLPKDITVNVINRIPLIAAIDIVRKHRSSAFIYDEVDPILYVVRFFSDSKNKANTYVDPHCREFHKDVLPKESVLDFVFKCKQYLTKNDFQVLIGMMFVH